MEYGLIYPACLLIQGLDQPPTMYIFIISPFSTRIVIYLILYDQITHYVTQQICLLTFIEGAHKFDFAMADKSTEIK